MGGKLGFTPMLIVLKNPSPPREICHIYGLELGFKNNPEILFFS